MKTVLTIAGSDCSGGAGIQADLKTIGAFGLYGMSVITAVTVQNTMGVQKVEPLEAQLVEEQMRAVFEDIMPDAVKIGMVVTEQNIHAVARVLREYKESGGKPFVVLDPVLISTSGRKLLEDCAEEALREELFRISDLITPNLPEAERIGNTQIANDREREETAENIARTYGCSVLVKGGHGTSRSDDLLYPFPSESFIWYPNEKIANENTHGTGCTLSSAIACNLAQGKNMEKSVRAAKQYITGAIRDGMDLGHGNGPLNHFFEKM